MLCLLRLDADCLHVMSSSRTASSGLSLPRVSFLDAAEVRVLRCYIYLANTVVVVVAPRYLDELKSLPDDVLSMEDAVAQVRCNHPSLHMTAS